MNPMNYWRYNYISWPVRIYKKNPRTRVISAEKNYTNIVHSKGHPPNQVDLTDPDLKVEKIYGDYILVHCSSWNDDVGKQVYHKHGNNYAARVLFHKERICQSCLEQCPKELEFILKLHDFKIKRL